MSVSKILCPLRGDERGEGTLGHAVAIGRPFNAHVEVIFCQVRTRDLMPHTDMVPGFMRGQIEEMIAKSTGSEGEHMREVFTGFASSHGIEVIELETVAPADRLTMAFRTEQGRQAQVIGVRGRLCDLVVVAQPDERTTLGVNTLHSSLMNTGRPVLMCPPGPAPESLGRHVAIAWNGSTEAARAVALSTDILHAAERVTALSVGPMPAGATVEDLVHYLAVRGVTCGKHPLGETDDIGEALLGGAAEVGADMLLMGAYSRGRGQEALFGGTSHHIVHNARMPVLMTH